MKNRVLLFHVTPTMNVESIMVEGINPARSTGKRERAWLVNGSRVLWALCHISIKYNLPIGALSILKVAAPATQVRLWSIPGVFFTNFTMKTSHPLAAYDWIARVDQAELARWKFGGEQSLYAHPFD